MLFLVDSPLSLFNLVIDDFTNPRHSVFYIEKPDSLIIFNFDK